MKIILFLNSKTILSRITSYDIFKYYINNFDKLGKLFCSELRPDKNPTAVVKYINNDYYYKDFKQYGLLNCFDYIKAKYGVNFGIALEIINQDFNLELSSLYPKKLNHKTLKVPILYNTTELDDSHRNEHTIIEVKFREWNNLDKQYWYENYSISVKDLQKYKVFPLYGFWINSNFYKADNVSYGYYFGNIEGREIWKIYQPYSKFKWITNADSSIYQGYNQLPENGSILILTKSYKDVIVLSKLGIPAIAPQSEVCNINDSTILELKSRFDEIKILFDNDSTGVENAVKLSNSLELDCFFMPIEQKLKDASDYVKKYSLENLKIYLKSYNVPSNNS